MKVIETIEEWATLAVELRAAGYTLFQFQFDAQEPEGFHAWFWASGQPQVHVVTHSLKVQEAIVDY